jgi:nitroreductase
MTSVIDVRRTAALRRAAVRATFAPSVHNTQPWRFRLRENELNVYADRSRQLKILDPNSRQLTVSCGSALMNARVSIASSGFGARVERLPDDAQPDLLARITTTDEQDTRTAGLADLDGVVEMRHTNRRRFADDEVPSAVLEVLELAAAVEDSVLFVIRREGHRLAVAMLSQRADALENANAAYRAEMRAWTTEDPRRSDGVPARAVAHVDGVVQDEVPLRDFDTHGTAYLPADTHSTHSQCLVLLGTAGDRPIDWLRGGEALERVLLEITKRGFVAGPLTQAVEMPFARAGLRAELGLTVYPQVLLRVGRAPMTPASRRRRLVDVLVEDA